MNCVMKLPINSQNAYCASVEVWKEISNFIPKFIVHVITCAGIKVKPCKWGPLRNLITEIILSSIELNHRPLDKMDAISKTIYSDALASE